MHFPLVDGFGSQRDGAVTQDHPVAGLQVDEQRGVVHRDALDGGGPLGGGEHQPGAAHQHPTAIGELTRAHLRAGQIGQHRHHLAGAFGGGSHGLEALDVRLQRAVAEVEPHHVDAGEQEVVEHLRRLAGRPQRGDDLRSGIGSGGHQVLI